MYHCPACNRESVSQGRFCSWCAAPVDVTSAETAVLAAVSPGATPVPVSHLSSSSSVDEGRFLPGTVLAGRYRIAGLLGRGGMGEVYRASDLALGQAVALKFLPETMARDDRALARFYNEVRIARQVTHSNVCRVYDIGQVDGLHYISMEFVDGEDLASLLRRIGRLPADKALEAARKLCAGLAAAHDKGVLHRDLKPANIMIDGRGQIVIMDFGLAGLAEQVHSDIRSGTPAYMAPEQLAGTEVSVRSDIYALGLVLYELFTGRRAFEASSLMELMQMQERAAPASITSVAKDLDPVAERIILRCLQPDPRERPASALAVAAALPGGDPLAAALAAGETPSPGLVAAAGETEGLRLPVALAWLAAALVGIAIVGVAGTHLGITSRVNLDAPPEALARDAQKIVQALGYSEKPGSVAFDFSHNILYTDYLRRHPDLAAERWKNPAAGIPPLIFFWYRQSPRELVAQRNFATYTAYTDPPMELSGMIRLRTDTEGHLRDFEAVPPQVEPDAPPQPAPDWAVLFRAAGLDQASFQPKPPEWTPLANWDFRAAWQGQDPAGHTPLRIEAAAWRGRPVFFRVLGPWNVPDRMPSAPESLDPGKIVIYFSLISAAFIAWWNVRGGRADLKGAAKLGLLYAACLFGGRLLSAHHTAGAAELDVFWKSVSVAMINGAVVWAFYVALEPWVRRTWPQTLIAWSRYTTKGLKDPLVGRDILFAAVFAVIVAGLELTAQALHGAGAPPLIPTLAPLSGIRFAVASVCDVMTGSLFDPMMHFFVFFILRAVLRKQAIAAVAFVVLIVVMNNLASDYPRVDVPVWVVLAVFVVFVLLRFGILALMALKAFSMLLMDWPRTLDFSQWYAGVGVLPLLLVAVAAMYGFRISLGPKLFSPPAPAPGRQ
jgi:predicted Ser/Thr protein kinase